VGSFANLEAAGGLDDSWHGGVAVLGGVGGFGKVEDAENLFIAASRNEVGVVRGVGNGANDVVMLDSIERLAGVGVPDFAMGMALALGQRGKTGASPQHTQ
jgi:hypothetical protein